MAKKNLGQGIDALFGGKKKSREDVTPKAVEKKETENTNPIKTHTNPALEKEVKVCIQVEEGMLQQFKAIAHMERMQQKHLMKEMIREYASLKGKDYMETAISNFEKYSKFR